MHSKFSEEKLINSLSYKLIFLRYIYIFNCLLRCRDIINKYNLIEKIMNTMNLSWSYPHLMKKNQLL